MGWLAVALSMAAIGTASLARVGMGTAPSLPQITVRASADAGSAASAAAAVSDDSVTIPAPIQPVQNAVPLSQYQDAFVAARTIPPLAARPSRTSQPVPTSGDSTVPALPNEAVLPSEKPTITAPAAVTTPRASTTPPASTTSAVRTTPDRRDATHTADPPDAAAASPTQLAVSISTWHPQVEVAPSGCTASEPLAVDPDPSTGGDAQRTW